MHKDRILIVADEKDTRDYLCDLLPKTRYSVVAVSGVEDGLKQAKAGRFDLAVLDLSLPGARNAVHVFVAAKAGNPDFAALLIGPPAETEAFFDVLGPARSPGRLACIRNSSDPSDVVGRIRKILEDIRLPAAETKLVGDSPAMKQILRRIERVAGTNVRVLIHGQTGTGKEVVARAIHERSDRRSQPFVAVNCAALPHNLVESELFGYAKGAFTGADNDHPGRFQCANNGTIFLDEVGEMPLDTQPKLLRVLESREVHPLGSQAPIPVDVRLISATNSDLQEKIRGRKFRQDLYYRINTVQIEVAPLCQRKKDIPQLVKYFLDRVRSEIPHSLEKVSPDAMELLAEHGWPGNVRELLSAVEHAATLADGPELRPEHLPDNVRGKPGQVCLTRLCSPDRLDPSEHLYPQLRRLEEKLVRDYLVECLERCDGFVSKAARAAGVDRKTFSSLLGRHGINWHDFRST